MLNIMPLLSHRKGGFMKVDNEFCIKWEKLVYKIARKHKDNYMNVELDDLIQIGFIGLIRGGRNYKEDKGIPLINFLARCISQEIFKEFQILNYDKRKANWKAISLDTPTTEDEDLSIGDAIEDTSVNVAQEVEDKIIYEFYSNMFYELLDKNRAIVLDEMLINGKTYEDLSSDLDIKKEILRDRFCSGKKILIKRSAYLRKKRNEYYKMIASKTATFYKSSAEEGAMRQLLWEV